MGQLLAPFAVGSGRPHSRIVRSATGASALVGTRERRNLCARDS